jgi:hypothetical protein
VDKLRGAGALRVIRRWLQISFQIMGLAALSRTCPQGSPPKLWITGGAAFASPDNSFIPQSGIGLLYQVIPVAPQGCGNVN